MGTQIGAGSLLALGLDSKFQDTYLGIQNRQATSKLAKVMDLTGTDARTALFAYMEASPHMEYWRMGDMVPTKAMNSVQFEATHHNFARRIPWNKWDAADDQLNLIYRAVEGAAQSAALLPERIFFDLLEGTTTVLGATVNAPDGVGFFSATDGGGGARFDISGGNIVTGTGVAALATVMANYYTAITRFLSMQDGEGQPLWSPEIVDAGTTILHSSTDLQVFEQAFYQLRQGAFVGTDAGVTPSNIIKDASRNVDLWHTSRLATGDWYVFLDAAPMKPTSLLDREGVSTKWVIDGGDGNTHTNDYGEEYFQAERRAGGIIGLPYGAIKVNN